MVLTGGGRGVRRQKRSETSKPLLLHTSLRHATSSTVSFRDPGHCLRVCEVATAPEARVAEGGGQGEVVRGVGQELPNEV